MVDAITFFLQGLTSPFVVGTIPSSHTKFWSRICPWLQKRMRSVLWKEFSCQFPPIRSPLASVAFLPLTPELVNPTMVWRDPGKGDSMDRGTDVFCGEDPLALPSYVRLCEHALLSFTFVRFHTQTTPGTECLAPVPTSSQRRIKWSLSCPH